MSLLKQQQQLRHRGSTPTNPSTPASALVVSEWWSRRDAIVLGWSDGAMEVVETKTNTVIIDCYNANPSSVESTLRAFAASDHIQPLAILGDMMELGEHAPSGHRLVRDVAAECGIECWTVGSLFAQHAPGDQSFDALDALQRLLENQPESGRTILLKGSRSMKLETLVPRL